ncbi:hypothetical protein Ddye_027546 [Dipteronia dyeriana]|uniref:KIB1-4 beta-propeller domain-containing protein n=1 Tax=Dipteronia dyeriana TaxID=168575 RepID=A0AAD9WQL1_9ROSI|nr:hypothetical protein Ddye_027546 [Dipteronia dyeriana]
MSQEQPEKKRRELQDVSIKIHEIPLLEEEKGNIWYSSSGFWWLITIGVEPPHEIGLFNPFTRDRITLPRASDLLKVREELRVITSANPLIDPKFSVLATHSCVFKIAFCRPGDSSWTSIKGFQGICNDTIFHKGEFFAVNHRGDLFRINCDFESNCIYFIDDADVFNMTTKYLNKDTGLYSIPTTFKIYIIRAYELELEDNEDGDDKDKNEDSGVTLLSSVV